MVTVHGSAVVPSGLVTSVMEIVPCGQECEATDGVELLAGRLLVTAGRVVRPEAAADDQDQAEDKAEQTTETSLHRHSLRAVMGLGSRRAAAYASAMPRPAQPRVLVARRLDGWLVGWLAVLVWIVAAVVAHWGITFGISIVVAVYWIGAVVTAAHFGLSYHLAYSGGVPALRARPFVLVIGPAALVLVLLAVVVGVAACRAGSRPSG